MKKPEARRPRIARLGGLLARLPARVLAPDPLRESKQGQASGEDDDSPDDMEATTTCEGEERVHHAQCHFEYSRPD